MAMVGPQHNERRSRPYKGPVVPRKTIEATRPPPRSRGLAICPGKCLVGGGKPGNSAKLKRFCVGVQTWDLKSRIETDRRWQLAIRHSLSNGHTFRTLVAKAPPISVLFFGKCRRQRTHCLPSITISHHLGVKLGPQYVVSPQGITDVFLGPGAFECGNSSPQLPTLGGGAMQQSPVWSRHVSPRYSTYLSMPF